MQSNPNDLVALKVIAEVNVALKKYADAALAAQRYAELEPTDLDVQRVNFGIMQATGVSAEAMRKYADALRTKYPADPRFKIVMAWGYYFGRNRLEAADQTQADDRQYRALILSAAKDDPPSSQFVRTTIGLLERLGEFGAAEDLLNRGAAKFNDPQLTQQLIARLWESRKFSEVVSRLKDLDAAAPTANATLIAYKALALFQMGHDQEATALVDQLAARDPEDRAAYAWATTLKAQYATPAEDLETRMAHYQDVQTASPDNGYVAFLLGDSYAKLGENELALQAFRQSYKEMPSWSEPYARLSLLLVRQGRGDSPEAKWAAEQAWLAGTHAAGSVDLQAAIADIKVSYASLLASPDAKNMAELLDEVKQIQRSFPTSRRLCRFTSPCCRRRAGGTRRSMRSGRVQESRRRRGKPADGPGADQPRRQVGDGTGDLCGDPGEIWNDAAAGVRPGDEIVQRRAAGRRAEIAAGRSGQKQNRGRLRLHGRRRGVLGAGDMPIPRSVARSRRAAAWEKLGKTYPDDIDIQSAILSGGNSAWADRDFIRQTIDRLKSLTGDAALGWKTAYARWLLTGSGAEKDTTEAVVLLTGVTTQNPDEYLPHVLLATAYDRLNNTSGGLEEWHKAAALAPQSPQAQFALLQALHDAGKKNEAQVVFDKLAGMSNLPPDLALAAATIIAAEGDMPRAEKMLLAYPNTQNQVLHAATLAKVYRLENRPNDAARIYFDLAGARHWT